MNLDELLYTALSAFAPIGSTNMSIVGDVHLHGHERLARDGYATTVLFQPDMRDGVKAEMVRYCIADIAFCIVSLTENSSTKHFCLPGKESNAEVLNTCRSYFLKNIPGCRKALAILLGGSFGGALR